MAKNYLIFFYILCMKKEQFIDLLGSGKEFTPCEQNR